MASNLRMLLRLPPGLRQSLFFSERFTQFSISTNGRHQLRNFTCTKNLARNPPPKPTVKRAGEPVRQAPLQRPPIRTLEPKQMFGPSTTARLNTIAPEFGTVLLYSAPRHGTFYAVSYLTGGALVLAAYINATTLVKEDPAKPKMAHWLRILESLQAVFMAALATAAILAPTKMIKSIAIVSANGSRFLRFEIKRALPFLKPDILEAQASKVVLDRGVPGFAQDLKINNIRLNEVKSFTEEYFSKSKETSQRRGVRQALSSFNKSLLNVWPATNREIRRMFMRDQMAYVRVGDNGRFKLDIRGCSLLEQGRPLEQITKTDTGDRPSLVGWLVSWLGR